MYCAREPTEKIQKIRDQIDYSIIDADAHVIEARFSLHDFVKKIAGPEVLRAFETKQEQRTTTKQETKTINTQTSKK